MKQSVATARLYQQTLEKSAQSVDDLGFKVYPSSQLVNSMARKREERMRV
jgi:hypothetical protein